MLIRLWLPDAEQHFTLICLVSDLEIMLRNSAGNLASRYSYLGGEKKEHDSLNYSIVEF